MSSPLIVHLKRHGARTHRGMREISIPEAGEDGRRAASKHCAPFHLPHLLSNSARPTHLYVFAVVSSSHLEKVAPPHLFHLISTLSLLPPLTLSFDLLWSRLFILFCSEKNERHLWWRIRSDWKINELDWCGVGVYILDEWKCVCVCVCIRLNLPPELDSRWAYPFVPEYTHTGSEPKCSGGKQHLC